MLPSGVLTHFKLWRKTTLEELLQLLWPKENRCEIKVTRVEPLSKTKTSNVCLHMCLLISEMSRLDHNCEDICPLLAEVWTVGLLETFSSVYTYLDVQKCSMITNWAWSTHLQALVLTQMVLTSSLVVSSSTNTPRWLFTNLRHKDFNRPIWLQMDASFVLMAWQSGLKKSHRCSFQQDLPPLGAFGVQYFTSAVVSFPMIFFTFFKAHLHAQHTPGSYRQKHK